MNANEARKLSAKHKESQDEIKKLIKKGEEKIKWACQKGRRYTDIYAGYVIGDRPRYPEVIEHFKDLGYEVKLVYGTNLFDIRW